MTIKFEEERFTQRKDKVFDGARNMEGGRDKKPKEITMTYKEGEALG